MVLLPFVVFSENSSSRDLQISGNPQKLEDNQGVQDGKDHNGAKPIEDLRDDQVGLEYVSVRYINVLVRLPPTINPAFIEVKAGGGIGGF